MCLLMAPLPLLVIFAYFFHILSFSLYFLVSLPTGRVRGSSLRLSIFAHVKKAAVLPQHPTTPQRREGQSLLLKALWPQLKHAPESRQRNVVCLLTLIDDRTEL